MEFCLVCCHPKCSWDGNLVQSCLKSNSQDHFQNFHIFVNVSCRWFFVDFWRDQYGWEHRITLIISIFSPFAAVSLFGVAGLAETFPFLSVSGPFLLDFPGFQVPSDSIFPSQLWSSSRALPLHLHFCNCSDVFSFTSSFDVSKPFQPSPYHNRRYRFHLCFFQDLLISPVF